MSREKKFTPGPWAIMNASASWLIYGPLGERICKMLSPDRYKVREANANLIAAAPELLKELESHCQACMERNSFKNGCPGCFTQRVIKKAYGEK